MFTWLNKQGVQSDRGFSIQFTGRFTAEYREGDKKLSLEIENGLHNGKPCIIIGQNVFEHWDGDPSYLILPAVKQNEILANFTEAMEFQGLEVVIE